MLPDAFGAVAELAASQHGVVSGPQAAALGISPSTIRSWVHRGRLWQPAPGAFVVPGVPPTWRTHLAIASAAHGGIGVISHRAAAGFFGLDGFERPFLEVTTFRGRKLRLPGFVCHTTDSLRRDQVLHIDGIQVTSVARTLVDLGMVVDEDLVWKATDAAIRKGASVRWISSVLAASRRRGHTGAAVLKRVLDRHGRLGVTDSFFETRLVEQLTRPDLPEPVTQHPIVRGDGRLVAVVDVAFPTIRVAVEAHSKRFHHGERMNARDADRQHDIEKEGWDVVFVRHEEVDEGRSGDKVVAYVRARRSAV